MIELTFDDKKAIEALKTFGKSAKSIGKSILNAIGNDLKKAEKRTVYDYFTERSGDLKRLMTKSVKRDGSAVSVYSKAVAEDGTRYPFILAAQKDYLSATRYSYESSDEMAMTIDKVLAKAVKKTIDKE